VVGLAASVVAFDCLSEPRWLLGILQGKFATSHMVCKPHASLCCSRALCACLAATRA
jgi:hypothetical protein